jgi:hypothetical protein
MLATVGAGGRDSTFQLEADCKWILRHSVEVGMRSNEQPEANERPEAKQTASCVTWCGLFVQVGSLKCASTPKLPFYSSPNLRLLRTCIIQISFFTAQ